MERPLLNTHNKHEFEPAHTAEQIAAILTKTAFGDSDGKWW